MDTTKEKLMSLLADIVEKDVSEIDEDMEPVKELDMDSVRLLDFVLLIEDEYEIEFQDFSKMSQHMSTVKEMIDFLSGVIEGGTYEHQ